MVGCSSCSMIFLLCAGGRLTRNGGSTKCFEKRSLCLVWKHLLTGVMRSGVFVVRSGLSAK